jgi:hypothetical protein
VAPLHRGWPLSCGGSQLAGPGMVPRTDDSASRGAALARWNSALRLRAGGGARFVPSSQMGSSGSACGSQQSRSVGRASTSQPYTAWAASRTSIRSVSRQPKYSIPSRAPPSAPAPVINDLRALVSSRFAEAGIVLVSCSPHSLTMQTRPAIVSHDGPNAGLCENPSASFDGGWTKCH